MFVLLLIACGRRHVLIGEVNHRNSTMTAYLSHIVLCTYILSAVECKSKDLMVSRSPAALISPNVVSKVGLRVTATAGPKLPPNRRPNPVPIPSSYPILNPVSNPNHIVSLVLGSLCRSATAALLIIHRVGADN